MKKLIILTGLFLFALTSACAIGGPDDADGKKNFTKADQTQLMSYMETQKKDAPQTTKSSTKSSLKPKGCGWEYPVCISWCMANMFNHTCFSFCYEEFC